MSSLTERLFVCSCDLVATLWLHRGACVHCLQTGMTAFDAACKGGELERVQAWITAGVDVGKRMEVRFSFLCPPCLGVGHSRKA